MPELEFFFDVSSPWTYLAFSRVEDVCARVGARVVWKPILVGGVFNAVNQDVYAARANPHPVKARYYGKDLQDWARFCGVQIGQPPIFPVRAVDPMRGAFFALDKGKMPSYARACFEAYWGNLKDISQTDVLGDICDRVGLDRKSFFEFIKSDDAKRRLRENTDELIERGGFGSPTMFIDGADMYFGNDRLLLVEDALGRAG